MRENKAMPRLPEQGGTLADLTVKQREALDLLLEHKTSKEISRNLGISPHTVDQRIEAAKRRLGATTRGELAQLYIRLRKTSGRLTHEEMLIDPTAATVSQDGSKPPDENDAEVRERGEQSVLAPPTSLHRVGPELFHGRWGTIFRLGAIMVIALLTMMVLLAVMSMMAETARFLS